MCSAQPRELGTLLERVECCRIAGAVLGGSEPHEEIRALGVGTIERGRQFERGSIVVRRLGGREVIEGVVAGAGRPALRLGRQAGEHTMRCELYDYIGGGRLGVFFQRAHDQSVDAGAPRRSELGVQRIRDQRVHESHRSTHLSGVYEQPGTDRRVERVGYHRPRELRDVGEQILPKLDAEHRRRRQHVGGVVTQCLHANPHDVAESLRNVRWSGGSDRVAFDASRLDPVPNQLRGIQRVPGRLVAQPFGKGVPPVTGRQRRRNRHEVGELDCVEAGELQSTTLPALEVGERETQLIGLPLARIPMAAHEKNRSVGERLRDVAQEQEGGRFRPLEVVEHQHQRSAGRDPAQQVGGRFEREEARRLVV